MADPRIIGVIDIGKTNAKVVVFDLATRHEPETLSTANKVLNTGPYPHYDIDGLWYFIVESFKTLGTRHKVDAISITTHGACAALLKENGALALPVLDYEHDGPQSVSNAYDALRPPFSETGSPRLPNGLNLGAQIFWQAKAFSEQFVDVRWIVTYPQYWAFRLCGVLSVEATSLGCHTDLWVYANSDYSSLVDNMGWRKLMPAVHKSSDRLGTLSSQIARDTGLDLSTPVHCGIHDSNASLLPHLLAHEPPFSVVSTGTWVIGMAIGGKRMMLDPTRDTLVNVNAFGEAVPSARFMGGREFEMHQSLFGKTPSKADVDAVLKTQSMLLPAVVQGSGPFADRHSKCLNHEGLTPSQKQVVVSFYLALMAATCLEIAGADGDTIVEGPFASNDFFMTMLSAATARVVLATATATGTALGAALLCATSTHRSPIYSLPPPAHSAHRAYCLAWQKFVAAPLK